MDATNRTEGNSEPVMISDEEWQALQARDAQAEASAPAAERAAPAEPAEWNAGDWLRETFKDDPTFKDLSAEDFARLEALANEKHEEFAGEIQEWAAEKSADWAGTLRDGLREGMESNPALKEFAETRLMDGDMSEEDKAALKEIAEDLTPVEGAQVIRPIVEASHEIHGEVIDGVEMIVDHAIEDVSEIVDARAEMPGGDSPQIKEMIEKLDAAPEQVHDALDWEREQIEANYQKVDDRLDLIEAGTDPRDIPPDTDTYQIDDNEGEYETAEA